METSLQRMRTYTDISYVFIQCVYARLHVRCPRVPESPGIDTHYLPTLYNIALGSSVKKKKKKRSFLWDSILQKIWCSKCGCKRSVTAAEAVKRRTSWCRPSALHSHGPKNLTGTILPAPLQLQESIKATNCSATSGGSSDQVSPRVRQQSGEAPQQHAAARPQRAHAHGD